MMREKLKTACMELLTAALLLVIVLMLANSFLMVN
jgi:hypothetical protein